MNEKRFTLRMNALLFEIVKKQSEAHKRSIAKEIEFIIEEYFIEKQILPPHEE